MRSLCRGFKCPYIDILNFKGRLPRHTANICHRHLQSTLGDPRPVMVGDCDVLLTFWAYNASLRQCVLDSFGYVPCSFLTLTVTFTCTSLCALQCGAGTVLHSFGVCHCQSDLCMLFVCATVALELSSSRPLQCFSSADSRFFRAQVPGRLVCHVPC